MPNEHAGLKLRCPACNAVFQLAGPRIEPAAAPAPAVAPSSSPPPVGPPSEPAPAGSATAAAPQAAATAVASNSPPPAIQTVAAGPDAAQARWSEPLPNSTPSTSGSSSRIMPAPSLPLRRHDWHAQVYLWIKPVLVLGLVMVLTARGCDTLAVKNVARLQGTAALAQRDFQEQTQEETAAIESQLSATNLSAAKRAELQKQLDDLRAAHGRRRNELEKGEWRDLTQAAERAEIEARRGGYGREMLFVAGTILFAIGLLTTALLGEGAERWFCLGLLVIVVFSVYIGGMAWSASLLNAVGR